MDNYGIDPMPKIQKILDEAKTMDDMEFHLQFADLFNSLHDAKTQYVIPGTYGCVFAAKPIQFRAVSDGQKLKIVVSSTYMNDTDIKVGDELIGVDGVSVFDYLDRVKRNSGGSTPSGSLRAALADMSSVDGRTRRLPDDNENTYLIKTREGNGIRFTIPWLAFYNDQCVQHTIEALQKIRELNSNTSSNQAGRKRKKPTSTQTTEKPSKNSKPNGIPDFQICMILVQHRSWRGPPRIYHHRSQTPIFMRVKVLKAQILWVWVIWTQS